MLNSHSIYEFKDGDSGKFVEIKVGQSLQWTADEQSDITFYEICDPPYNESRFLDLENYYNNLQKYINQQYE